MTIAGVAPKLAIPTIIYLIITILIDHFTYPVFKITLTHTSTLVIIGIVLILIGIGLIVNVAKKLLKSFKANILMKDGIYLIFRNPMYAAYLLFIFPGISLIFNSWLVFTSVILNFFLLQIFAKEEHKYLEEKFGKEYKKKKKKVMIKFL